MHTASTCQPVKLGDDTQCLCIALIIQQISSLLLIQPCHQWLSLIV